MFAHFSLCRTHRYSHHWLCKYKTSIRVWITILWGWRNITQVQKLYIHLINNTGTKATASIHLVFLHIFAHCINVILLWSTVGDKLFKHIEYVEIQYDIHFFIISHFLFTWIATIFRWLDTICYAPSHDLAVVLRETHRKYTETVLVAREQVQSIVGLIIAMDTANVYWKAKQ